MDEEDKTDEETKEEVKEEITEDKPTTPTGLSVIEEARKERVELQKQLDRKEALLNREEALEADRQLGGRAEAGGVKDKPKEISDVEYMEEVMSGKHNAKE